MPFDPLAPLHTTGTVETMLQKFFLDRCRANMHVLLVMEHQEQVC